MSTDRKAVRATFFRPHRDGEGCATPKPAALTEVLRDMDGKTMTLGAAAARIRAAAPGSQVQIHEDYISVHAGRVMLGGHRQLNYRAILFKEADDADLA